jgi:hypothetical protein
MLDAGGLNGCSPGASGSRIQQKVQILCEKSTVNSCNINLSNVAAPEAPIWRLDV